ncbi:MAG: hypothetical protein K0Q72_4187, partial [Armatimonadetes bacterium]|nr:hypothetical protein [Armatimonadota bacterium]
ELKQWLAYRSAKPERLCDHLIDCARERQARDNVTLVIVRDTPDPSPANSAFDRHLA